MSLSGPIVPATAAQTASECDLTSGKTRLSTPCDICRNIYSLLRYLSYLVYLFTYYWNKKTQKYIILAYMNTSYS